MNEKQTDNASIASDAHIVLVKGPLALGDARCEDSVHAVEEHTLAALCVPGNVIAIDNETLTQTINTLLEDRQFTTLNGLGPRKTVARATAQALTELERSRIEWRSAGTQDPTLETLDRIEARARETLGSKYMTKREISARAITHISETGQTPFAKLTVRNDAVRSRDGAALVAAIASRTPTRWEGSHGGAPPWTKDGPILIIERARPKSKTIQRTSCATPYHEIIEAIGFALKHLDNITAGGIAIATATPQAHEASLRALLAQAGISAHWLDGTPALETAAGQQVAAFATLAERTTTQDRLTRLEKTTGKPIPATMRNKFMGPETFGALAETMLDATALNLWNVLQEQHPGNVLKTLNDHRIEDTSASAGKIAIGSPGDIAHAGRNTIWVAGLTARSWPRGKQGEVQILGERQRQLLGILMPHTNGYASWVIDALAGYTDNALVLSRPRHDADGKTLNSSGSVPTIPENTIARRARVKGAGRD